LKKNILGVTLARGGSKGIKNKNLTKINGKPLIYFTIKEAKKCKKITNYIVSTDSNKIKKVAKKYKAKNVKKLLIILFQLIVIKLKKLPKNIKQRHLLQDQKNFQKTALHLLQL